jgi:hypothetical protein
VSYVSRPRRRLEEEEHDAWYDLDPSRQTAGTVYVDDEPETFTGLYDANGNEIHIITRQPIGFDLEVHTDET